MSTRKTTLFYASLIAVSSLAVGMVIASRFDMAPASAAQTLQVPPMNSAPVTGPLDAQTFRNVAKAQQPTVVNIRTESKAKGQDLSEMFGGGGGGHGSRVRGPGPTHVGHGGSRTRPSFLDRSTGRGHLPRPASQGSVVRGRLGVVSRPAPGRARLVP